MLSIIKKGKTKIQMCLKDILTFAPEGWANNLTGICRKPTLKKTLLSVLASKIKSKTTGGYLTLCT